MKGKQYIIYQKGGEYILASSRKVWEEYLKEDRYYQQMTSIQLVFDAVHITMHQIYGWGAERQKKLQDNLQSLFLDMCRKVSKVSREAAENRPSGVDKAVYQALTCAEAEADIEEALKAACGQYYADHNTRYTFYY